MAMQNWLNERILSANAIGTTALSQCEASIVKIANVQTALVTTSQELK